MTISRRIPNIPEGLAGELRRTPAGARYHIDHCHPELEFDIVLKGGGSFTVGERNYVLKPGILIWHIPGQQHRLVRSPGLQMWVVLLRPDVLGAERVAVLAEQPLRRLSGEALVNLDRLLAQVAQDSDQPAVYNAGLTYAALRAWQASCDSPAATVRPIHPAVARALIVLRESGAERSLPALAKEVGIAAPYLSRLLLDHTGRSFVDWRNRIRLDRFIAAYRPGGNLLDMALEAGFGSYARFNHVFNELVGCAPSEWIERMGAGEASAEPFAKDYGLPQTTLAGTRQRWTALVPHPAGAIKELLGEGFLARMLAGTRRAAETGAEWEADPSDLSRERLMESLRRQGAAPDVIELVATHDFAGLYASLLDRFDLSPLRLADAAAALLAALWTAANGATDPTPASVAATRRQVRAALGQKAAPATAAGDAHAALLCHFIVVYHALQAARASGDPRALERLSEAARACGHTLFDGDVTAIVIGEHGFAGRPAPKEPVRRRRATTP